MASEEEAYYGSPAPATPASKAVKSGSTPGKAKARTKRLEEDLAAAREETQAIRKKLHNAIRKGKGIEQEKNALAGEVKRWRQEAESLKENMADASAGGAAAEEEEVDALKREVTSLEQKLEVERKVSEAGGKETAAKLEEKEEECRSLRKEMEHLQSAVRSAAERAANATVNENAGPREVYRGLPEPKRFELTRKTEYVRKEPPKNLEIKPGDDAETRETKRKKLKMFKYKQRQQEIAAEQNQKASSWQSFQATGLKKKKRGMQTNSIFSSKT